MVPGVAGAHGRGGEQVLPQLEGAHARDAAGVQVVVRALGLAVAQLVLLGDGQAVRLERLVVMLGREVEAADRVERQPGRGPPLGIRARGEPVDVLVHDQVPQLGHVEAEAVVEVVDLVGPVGGRRDEIALAQKAVDERAENAVVVVVQPEIRVRVAERDRQIGPVVQASVQVRAEVDLLLRVEVDDSRLVLVLAGDEEADRFVAAAHARAVALPDAGRERRRARILEAVEEQGLVLRAPVVRRVDVGAVPVTGRITRGQRVERAVRPEERGA